MKRLFATRAIVFVVVAFAGFRAWSKHNVDVVYARAPEALRPCLSSLPGDPLGYAVDEVRGQAASWSAHDVALCDLSVETDDSFWNPGGPLLLNRRGATTGAFIDGELWLGFSGRLEHVGFGPPTGMDGQMYLWDTDPAISVTLQHPASLALEGRQVRVTDASGAVELVPLPH